MNQLPALAGALRAPAAEPVRSYDIAPAPTLPENQGIDPATLSAMLRGVGAGTELEGLTRALDDADAKRQLNVTQGQQIGNVYQAANPLAVLVDTLSSVDGQKEYDRLNEQANALRGDIGVGRQAGTEAELQSADALAQYQAQLAEADALTQRNQYVAGQENARDLQDARLGAQEDQFARAQKAKIDSENRAHSRKLADEERKVQQAEKERLEKHEREFAANNFYDMSDSDQKEITKSRVQLSRLKQIENAMHGLTEKDIEHFDNKALREVLVEGTPQAISNWMADNMVNLSPSMQEYMRGVESLTAEMRHALFGGALTAGEARSAKGFMPTGIGFSLPSQVVRLEGVQNQVLNDLNAYQKGDTPRDFTVGLELPNFAALRERYPHANEPQPIKGLGGKTYTESEINAMDEAQFNAAFGES